ncbi:MAG: 3'(2'),5'-bisphosphate nucleotidase CysQ [Paracoccaceae bacterium]|nr:3'(2'),5'-bisphosphate nucleotidase CysQ [Paracoccaceae bacterium]MDH5529898.1 3'(2'),5'-bisphosphate nucleotidase CysQ [Paracoccaceae bacterium]
MPVSDISLLTDAAYAAGDIARRFWRQDAEVWDKADDAGPVTEADLAVNEMLAEKLRKARPDYGWLSEETPDAGERLAADRAFIIDPIDGTRAFIAGEKTFSHSLAIAERGRIIAAVVYLPMYDALYAATEDSAATRNGAPIRVTEPSGAQNATLLTARVNLAPEHWQDGTPPPVKREFRASIAYRLCLVAEGRFDGMLTLRPTWEWDIAAGDLIARQAGARVTDSAGSPIGYNAPKPAAAGILAAGQRLHRDLIGRIRP